MRRVSYKAWEFFWDQLPSKELSYLIIAYRSELMKEFETRIQASPLNWQVVPGLNTLAISFDRGSLSLISKHLSQIQAWSQDHRTKLKIQGMEGLTSLNSNEMEATVLPILYDGIDLESVARETHLSVNEVIEIHSSSQYIVALMGFQKGFPYMLGLNHQLKLPRKETPNKRVPSGSVAIAEEMCGIYPSESPGGWHLIGQTDQGSLAKLKLGDRVTFRQVKAIYVD